MNCHERVLDVIKVLNHLTDLVNEMNKKTHDERSEMVFH